MDVYVIVTEDGVDQIVEGKVYATREVRDLKAMGFAARAKRFTDWESAQAYADKIENR